MDGDVPHIFRDTAHQDETRRLVRAMMALTHQTASGLARVSGLTPSTLNRFMHKAVGHTLSQRTMLAVMAQTLVLLKERPAATWDADALAQLAPAIPLYERGILDLAPQIRPVLDEVKARLGLAPPRTHDELPVVMAGSRGIDVQTGDFTAAPLKTARPPFLEGDAQAFAILMPDAAMSPRFDAGDILYVSPVRGLEGEHVDVVIERAAPRGGFVVASLTGLTATAAKIMTFGARPKRDTVPRSTIRGIYRIVGVQRLAG